MFENPRRGRQARNFTTNVSKILDLKSSSEQIFFRKFSLGAPELTLQRAGYFGKTAQQGEKMFVCAIHRANLGKDWGNPTGRTECRYPFL